MSSPDGEAGVASPRADGLTSDKVDGLTSSSDEGFGVRSVSRSRVPRGLRTSPAGEG